MEKGEEKLFTKGFYKSMFVALRSHRNIRLRDGSSDEWDEDGGRGEEGEEEKGTIYSCNVLWIKHEAPKKKYKERSGIESCWCAWSLPRSIKQAAAVATFKWSILKNYYVVQQAASSNIKYFFSTVLAHHLTPRPASPKTIDDIFLW